MKKLFFLFAAFFILQATASPADFFTYDRWRINKIFTDLDITNRFVTRNHADYRTFIETVSPEFPLSVLPEKKDKHTSFLAFAIPFASGIIGGIAGYGLMNMPVVLSIAGGVTGIIIVSKVISKDKKTINRAVYGCIASVFIMTGTYLLFDEFISTLGDASESAADNAMRGCY